MAARSTSASTSPTSASSRRRISFAKIDEPLEVPQLLSLQTDSFDWLIGNEKWNAVVERRLAEGEDVSSKSGLTEIFEEISPIEDFSETMSLSFENPVFYDPKYTVDECKEKDFTYSAPLYVSAEFTNNDTGEIKGQTVFMGDFPLMTPKGTFVINGTERVVVSQLVRSPGVYFERTADKTSDKDIYTSRLIPSRGAWLEFEIDKRDLVGVRLDRKRKQNITVLLKALQAVAEDIGEEYDYEAVMAELRQFESIQLTEEKDHTQGPDDALLDIYRKLRPGRTAHARGRADAVEELLLQPQALRPGQGRSLQDQQEARPGRGLRQADPDDLRRRRRHPLHRGAARRSRAGRGAPGQHRRQPRRHRPLRQPPHAHGRRADPEPAPHGPGPHGARGPRADDDPGRRGHHAAVADQHPPGRGGAEGVLRHLPAEPVHGPDQPDRRPDAQASPVRARARWSLP